MKKPFALSLARAAVLALLLTVAFGAAHAADTVDPSCGGYPVLSPADLGPLPVGVPTRPVALRPGVDGDRMADSTDGASAVYLHCGGSRYYRVLRSALRVELHAGAAGGWGTLSVPWEGDRSLLLDGRNFRLTQLPFAPDAPAEPVVEYRDDRFTMPLPWCPALRLHAPLYRIVGTPAEALELELRQGSQRIDLRRLDEHVFHRTIAEDVNHDGLVDTLLLYAERFGSGRQAYAAVLLNCGDGRYAVGGELALGADASTLPAPVSGTAAACRGAPATLIVRRPAALDPSQPQRGVPIHQDLYAYAEAEKRFVQVDSTLEEHSARCALIRQKLDAASRWRSAFGATRRVGGP